MLAKGGGRDDARKAPVTLLTGGAAHKEPEAHLRRNEQKHAV